jgi:hypothetical protein
VRSFAPEDLHGAGESRRIGWHLKDSTPEEARFNRAKPLLTRMIAAHPKLIPEIEAEIARRG